MVYGYGCYVVISHYLRGIPINFNNGGWQVDINFSKFYAIPRI